MSSARSFPRDRVQKLLDRSQCGGLTPEVEAEAKFIQLAEDGSPIRQVFLAVTKKEFFLVKQEISGEVHFFDSSNDIEISDLAIDRILPLPCIRFLILDDGVNFFSISMYTGSRYRFELCKLDLDTAQIWGKWRAAILRLGGDNRISNENAWNTSYVIDFSRETRSHPKLTRTIVKSADNRSFKAFVAGQSIGTQTENKFSGEFHDSNNIAAGDKAIKACSRKSKLLEPSPDIFKNEFGLKSRRTRQPNDVIEDDSASNSSTEYSLDETRIGYRPGDRLVALFTAAKFIPSSDDESLTLSKLRRSSSLNDLLDTQNQELDMPSTEASILEKLSKARRHLLSHESKSLDLESSSDSDGDDLDKLFEEAEVQMKHDKENGRCGRELWGLVRRSVVQARKTCIIERFQEVVQQVHFRTLSNRNKTLPQSITELDPMDLSLQLTNTSRKLFLAISLTDLDAFTRTQGKEIPPALRAVLKFSEDIRKMVATEVIKTGSLTGSVRVVKFFVQVGLNLLFRNNDFQSLMAVLRGVSSLPVYRLDNAWATFFVQEPFAFCHFLTMIQLVNPTKGHAAYASRVRNCIRRKSVYIPHLDHILEHCMKILDSQHESSTAGNMVITNRRRDNKGWKVSSVDKEKFTSKLSVANTVLKSIIAKEKRRNSFTDMLFGGKKKKKHRVTFQLDSEIEERHQREDSNEQLKHLAKTRISGLNKPYIEESEGVNDSNDTEDKEENQTDGKMIGEGIRDAKASLTNICTTFTRSPLLMHYCDYKANIILESALKEVLDLIECDGISTDSEIESSEEDESEIESSEGDESDQTDRLENNMHFGAILFGIENDALERNYPTTNMTEEPKEWPSSRDSRNFRETPEQEPDISDSYINRMRHTYSESEPDDIETNLEKDPVVVSSPHLPQVNDEEINKIRDDDKEVVIEDIDNEIFTKLNFKEKASKTKINKEKTSRKSPTFLKRIKNKFTKSKKADIHHINALQRDIDDIASLMSSFKTLDTEKDKNVTRVKKVDNNGTGNKSAITEISRKKSYVPAVVERGRRKSMFEEALINTEEDEEKEAKLFESLKNVKLDQLKRKGSIAMDLLVPDEEDLSDVSVSGGNEDQSSLFDTFTHLFKRNDKSNNSGLYIENSTTTLQSSKKHLAPTHSPRHHLDTGPNTCSGRECSVLIDEEYSPPLQLLFQLQNDHNQNSTKKVKRKTNKRERHQYKNEKRSFNHPDQVRCSLCGNKTCLYEYGTGNYLVQTQINLVKADVPSRLRVKECLRSIFTINNYLSDFDILQLSLYCE